MGRFVGDQNTLAFRYESGTYNTASGNHQWIGQVQNVEINESTNPFTVRYLGAGTRNVNAFINGPLDYDVSFMYYPQDFRFMMFALGSNVDSGSPIPYVHTISEVNSASGNAFTSGTKNPFMSFTLIESQKGPATGQNFVRSIQGCIVDSFTMSLSQGNIVSCDVKAIGQSGTYSSGAITLPTEDTTRSWVWQDFKVHIPSGTVFEDVTDAKFTVKNNLLAPHYLNGSRVIDVPIPQNRDYELALTLHATSEKVSGLYASYFLPGSEFNCMIEGVQAEFGAGSKSIYLVMSGCKLFDMKIPTKNTGVNVQSLTIKPKTVIAVANEYTTGLIRYNPW